MNFMNVMVIIFVVIAAGAGIIGYVSEYIGSNKETKEDEIIKKENDNSERKEVEEEKTEK
ncbi:MAG: hypothetical protein IJT72_05300 [Lachnospiraceae bacterium]|nr:hypothetical protein [Lachnospiraceae bacterium]